MSYFMHVRVDQCFKWSTNSTKYLLDYHKKKKQEAIEIGFEIFIYSR